MLALEGMPNLVEDRGDLTRCLEGIWRRYFSDTPRVNTVQIAYCYPWKSRLGLIRLSEDQRTSFIGVNSLLQLETVPAVVLLITIAHEMVHYAHGFGSPLPRPYQHPHANRVVDRELERRELGPDLQCCNEWIDNSWYSFYDIQRASGWTELARLAEIPVPAGDGGRASIARPHRPAPRKRA